MSLCAMNSSTQVLKKVLIKANSHHSFAFLRLIDREEWLFLRAKDCSAELRQMMPTYQSQVAFTYAHGPKRENFQPEPFLTYL
jgi:hypothetical protein